MLSAIVLTASVACAGQTFLYSPEAVAITLDAGASTEIDLDVTLDSIDNAQMVRFMGGISGGNLSEAWISSSSSYKFISKANPTVSTTITLRVPEGTPSGVYAGYLHSWGGYKPLGAGSGLYIELTVPAVCNSTPEITFGAADFWDHAQGVADIIAYGIIDNPEGCSLYEVYYDIEDDSGALVDSGDLEVNVEGEFDIPMPYEGTKTDAEGRVYQLTVSAENDEGVTTLGPFEIFVPYDTTQEQ